MSESITVQKSSLLEAIATLNQLGGILGKDSWIAPDYTLSIDLGLIDRKIEEGLNQQPEPGRSPKPIPEKLERWIELSNEQQLKVAEIEAQFIEDFQAEPRTAYQKRHQRRRKLRDEVIRPFCLIDIFPAGTLIYSAADDFQDAPHAPIVLPFPDGRERSLHSVLHFSPPETPEALTLRCKRLKYERQIIYFAKGLDDAVAMQLQRPEQPLDFMNFRTMLKKRYC